MLLMACFMWMGLASRLEAKIQCYWAVLSVLFETDNGRIAE
jgi:hypothetical protein